jgi:hypothetical protein
MADSIPDTSDDHFDLVYDLNGHRAFMTVRKIQLGPPILEGLSKPNGLQLYETWRKSAGSKISGIQDLPSSQLARLGDPDGLGGMEDFVGVDKSFAGKIVESVQRVRQRSKLISLKLNFSGELRWRLTTTDSAVPILSIFSPWDGSQMRRVKRSNKGELPYYVCDLPSYLRSPIR